MRYKSGFTLMELMVVIAIIGIISAISIPNLIGWLPNYRLGGGARDILSIVQTAKIRAIKDRVNVVIIFQPATNSYTAFYDNGPGAASGNWALDAGETIIANKKVPNGIDLNNTTLTANTIGLSPRGMLLSGATGGIVALKNSKRYLGVSITLTGDSRIVYGGDGVTWQHY